MTTRQDKVSSLLHQLISSFLIEQRPEGITGLLTITKVEVTRDLEHAKVFFSIVGQTSEGVEKILRKQTYDIQGMLYDKLEMRKIPRVHFVLDTSGEYAGHINKLLHKLKEQGDDQS